MGSETEQIRIAVGSDMKTGLTDWVVGELGKRGYRVDTYGALGEGPSEWPKVGTHVAERVAAGEYSQAILFCWTGTGISIAANKVPGIRAALCTDSETAAGARKWNDANILTMSLRLVSEAVAGEILDAWFSNGPSGDSADAACLRFLADYDAGGRS